RSRWGLEPAWTFSPVQGGFDMAGPVGHDQPMAEGLQSQGATARGGVKPDAATLPLSVAIVCRNNERTIGRTLESVRGMAAEIVAVDSGSTDGTIDLLEQAGARVIRSEWLGHVKTKQMALEACSQEWVLCLDS